MKNGTNHKSLVYKNTQVLKLHVIDIANEIQKKQL